MADPSLKIRPGVLLYTYDRVDDARINMEIIRNTWKELPVFQDIPMVHAFNGVETAWPEPYLENALRRTENPGHFKGAELLLNKGMKAFVEEYPDVTHVIVLAADTWCARPQYMERVLQRMVVEDAYLATCAWGNKHDTDMFKIGMSLDFFVVDLQFVRKSNLFPLRYAEFIAAHGEVLMYQGTLAFLERVFALRFQQAIGRTIAVPSENLWKEVAYAHVTHLKEREPVHYDQHRVFQKPKGIRHMHWPRLGLITHHEPKEKQRVLRTYPLSLGEYGARFLAAKDFSYFNGGKEKTSYRKGDKEIHYND